MRAPTIRPATRGGPGGGRGTGPGPPAGRPGPGWGPPSAPRSTSRSTSAAATAPSRPPPAWTPCGPRVVWTRVDPCGTRVQPGGRWAAVRLSTPACHCPPCPGGVNERTRSGSLWLVCQMIKRCAALCGVGLFPAVLRAAEYLWPVFCQRVSSTPPCLLYEPWVAAVQYAILPGNIVKHWEAGVFLRPLSHYLGGGLGTGERGLGAASCTATGGPSPRCDTDKSFWGGTTTTDRKTWFHCQAGSHCEMLSQTYDLSFQYS